MRRFLIVSVALAAVLAQMMAPTTSHAGTSGGASQRVTGTVKDALGRPLSEANVVLQAADGHEVARTRSQSVGQFEFNGITPGTYAVVVQKTGFNTATAIVTVTSNGAKPITLAMASQEALSLAVTAKRTDGPRNGLSPETGTSVYHFSEKPINDLRPGNPHQVRAVLRSAPRVAQD